MLHIAVDTIVTRPPFVYRGMFEYTKEMVEHFRLLAQECDVDVRTYVGSGFSPEIAGIPETENYHTEHCSLMDHLRLWRFGGGARLVKREGNDVLFATNAETISIPGVPYVVFIHDVDFMRFRQYGALYTARLYAMQWLASHSAKLVLTNSECSKRDIVKYLRVSPEKVVVTYLGYNRSVYNQAPAGEEQAALAQRFSLQRRYILHHGTFQPRKNLLRLVRAYDRLAAEDSAFDYDLVLAGNYGWNCEDVLQACRDVKVPGRVVVTGFLEEKDLAALVKGAYLSVIPSLWEGFCFPMVESMACGVPTIAANSSCLPEISGGVLHYFNAESVEEIAASIKLGIEDNGLREQLCRDGLRSAAQFSWERCARETLTAIKRVTAETH